MKKLAVILTVMGLGVYLMLTEKDKKRVKNQVQQVKKKIKKTHFPAKDLNTDV
jgi:hypothetical protein